MSTTWNNANSEAISAPAKPMDLDNLAWNAMRALGSLKITVTMFALGIVILFVGTLAQDEETLVDVKAQYFNSWVAVVPLDVFKPVTIWPNVARFPFSFPMPGGATIGLVLLVNLIFAKITRFAIHAKGGRLVVGSIFTTLGFALVGLVVLSAHLGDGLQGEPPFSYDHLWLGCKASVFLAAAMALAWSIAWPPKTKIIYRTSWVIASILMIVALTLVVTGDSLRIPDPGLRITWQLTKSLLVGGVLLTGLIILFGRRGGNVLIHLGVGLLMLGQFIFGDHQVEERMTLLEGNSTNQSYRIDEVELALIESISPEEDRVIAVSEGNLKRTLSSGEYFRHDALPVEVQVKEWMDNSRFAEGTPGPENLATKGVGLQAAMKRVKKSGGADSEINVVSAYISFRDKAKNDLGTYLLTQVLHDGNLARSIQKEILQVGDRTFELQFRFRQTQKDYKVDLIDVNREDYTGTATPRNYSSDIKIVGNDGVSQQSGHVWMNNPLRFQGETFYQSGYQSARETGAGVEGTTLQVVANAGWLIPYVSCILCGLGMLVHFGGSLAVFASRYERVQAAREPVKPMHLAVVGLATLGTLAIVAMQAMPGKSSSDEFQWYGAGGLPMQHEGRIKPLDTVARNILQALSNRSVVYEPVAPENKSMFKSPKKISATRWLLSMMANDEWTLDVPIIRIDSKEVLQTLKLEDREGHRFSFNEVKKEMDQLTGLLRSLDPKNEKNWTLEQKMHAQAYTKYHLFETLYFAYQPLIPDPPPKDAKPEEINRFFAQIDQLTEVVDRLEAESPAGIIPPQFVGKEPSVEDWEKGQWQTYGTSLFRNLQAKIDRKPMNDAMTRNVGELLTAVKKSDPRAFNSALRTQRELLAKQTPSKSILSKANFEGWFNKFSPIYLSAYLYLLVGILAITSLAAWNRPLRWSALSVFVCIFLVHTLAIACRIYISGRPPVVNLYSSAVFIGWAVVLFALVVELLYPISLGLIVGAIVGFLSLLVAYGLDTSDTMPVLQAVLDTQFWLATHVVCVTLGYAATFLAGAFGIAIICMRVFAANRTSEIKTLDTVCYGIVCFALFFSFVGTVLGGLWGDDSWGRFWGWDPKENGALMIVLWNAILLHARWDKMVRQRGFALLTIGGNIVTSWSWFGTNQLGIGLHSYGFTSGILLLLGGFVLSQLVIIFFGWFFTKPQTSAT